MIASTRDQKGSHRVEPICDVLPIAPSPYFDRPARRADPAKLAFRAQRGARPRPDIPRIFDANFRVYRVCARSGDQCSGRPLMSPAARLAG